MMHASALYPLLTDRRLVETLWGGTRLARWLDLDPVPERLGESWQVHELNRIRSGSLAGLTLGEAVRSCGAGLIGTRTMRRYGTRFPLLAKFIDAAERLSIQVHPDDDYAQRVERSTGFSGKAEAWHVLHAEPDAAIAYGLARAATRAEIAASVEDCTLDALLREVRVAAGDTIYLPAGTVHTIGAGIMLFEIQQHSDLTYRLYDYGRNDPTTGRPRRLHVAKALDVMQYAPASRVRVDPVALGSGRELLTACSHFALERWTIEAALTCASDPATFEILTLIEGRLVVRWPEGMLALGRGQSAVIPAGMGSYEIEPEARSQLLRVYVPEVEEEAAGA